MVKKKLLASVTFLVALFSFFIMSFFHWTRSSPSVETNDRFLSFGKKQAPIHVVLIEDFQCKNCRAFTQKLIPNLKKSYLRSGKVRFTLVPVSFLSGSQAMANAAIEVYHQAPHKFFEYLDAILAHEGTLRKEDLMRFARRISGLDLAQLDRCITAGCHNKELSENLKWAQSVMGAQFRTPSLYVNGNVGSTYSYEAVQYQIEHILGGK